METIQKHTSIIERIRAGERVKCEKCHKGYLEPFNPKAEVNHGYTCDYCGAHYHWDPVVIVE